MNITVTSFYDFFSLDNLEHIKEKLLDFCKSKGIKGTILIASEGVNSTISGKQSVIDEFYKFNKSLFERDFIYKESYVDYYPFEKMKVKIKNEIVTMGIKEFNTDIRGNYIKPAEWDSFISQENTILIDTRNNYEVALGSFRNAINPQTDNFREFPKWFDDNIASMDKEQKIAMFCTGGIRCEKSTSYARHKGFNNIYHLEGGIIAYLDQTNNESKNWQGDCFVFDERVTVDNILKAGGSIICKKCEDKVTTEDIKLIKAKDSNICYSCFVKN